VAAGYFYASNPSTSGQRIDWANSSSDSLFISPVNAGYATAHSMGIARGAVQYVISSLALGGSYSNVQLKRDGKSTFASNEHFNVASAFATYQVTPAMLLGAGYTYTKSGGDTSATYHQVSIGADYAFTKRTDVYALAAYQHASGTQRNADGTTQDAQASIGSYGFAGTSTQELGIVGIRHKF
jgi:predicted porin